MGGKRVSINDSQEGGNRAPKLDSRFHSEFGIDGLAARNGLVQKSDGLDARNLKALATAHVLAHQYVVLAKHVGPCLGEASPVALIGPGGQSTLLGADQPTNLVFGRLVAVRAAKVGRFSVGSFVEKLSLVHRNSRRSSVASHQRNKRRMLIGIIAQSQGLGATAQPCGVHSGREIGQKEEAETISSGDRREGNGTGSDRYASPNSDRS